MVIMLFRKITAKEYVFNQMKYRFRTFFKDYEEFVSNNELGYSRGVNKSSGKAMSYKNYLIRLFIFTEEISKINISNPISIETYKMIENIKLINGYQEYNKSEHYFPNATINYFLSYVSKELMEQEFIMDSLSDQIVDFNFDNNAYTDLFIEEDIQTPIKKTEPILLNEVYKYKRNILEVKKAKIKSNWTCENDDNHITFINNYDKKPFIEAHHLIPMATQGLFEYSIDFADNIICLCPTCHKRIHYGVKTDKSEMISKFYKDRIDKIKRFNIDASIKDIEIFYNIN